jgi:hypothetical protein
MSLLFRYTPVPVGHPVVPLPGRVVRPRPLILIGLTGPTGSWATEALLDTGADDSVFSDQVAAHLGINLAGAPIGAGAGAGSGAIPLRYAEVELRLSDGKEQREWTAWVAFTAARMQHPMLGFAGVLQFFTATFRGETEEVQLTVNGLYPGT